jgi:hypothetical protein
MKLSMFAVGELDRPDRIDEERAVLALEDEGVVVAQRHLGPDPAEQQPVVGTHVGILDVEEIQIQTGQTPPVLILGLDQLDVDLIDDLIGPVLLDR